MPDITMCEGTACPLRARCYRFTAAPNEYRQSPIFPTMPMNEFLAWHAVNLAQIRLRLRDLVARLDIEDQIIRCAERVMRHG